MIFQKPSSEISLDENEEIKNTEVNTPPKEDDVDTVVGPSVNVEGDFSSEGNIIVKGTVSGSVHTLKHLLVEQGAKIMANVKSGSATISGIVKGNVKVTDSLVLTETAEVLGDIDVKILKVEAGAVLHGKVTMKTGHKEALSKIGDAEKAKFSSSIRKRRIKGKTE